MGLKNLYIDMDNVLVDFPSGIARIPPEVVDQYDERLDGVHPSYVMSTNA